MYVIIANTYLATHTGEVSNSELLKFPKSWVKQKSKRKIRFENLQDIK